MNQKHQNVPIWEKANLTLEEAAAFTRACLKIAAN